MFGCDRCKETADLLETSFGSENVRLLGNVYARLCNSCRTDLSMFFFGLPENAEKMDLEARERHYESLAKAGTPATESQWRDLIRARNALSVRLHAVVLAWLKTAPEKPE